MTARLFAPNARFLRVPAGRCVADRRRWVLASVLTLLTSFAPLLHAGAVDLARVGASSIDSTDFERRARLIAAGQWVAWGATWVERRRRFLEEVLVAEALLSLEAERDAPKVLAPRDVALARALRSKLEASTSTEPPKAEIESYFERHRGEFESPASILIWRIAVREEKEARDIIAQLDKPTAADFGRLARERSIDDATSMRGGNLGFVAADGQTDMPEVRVSMALFVAASKVQDGELVKEPVVEGEKFAVIWRRASQPARRASLADVSPVIGQRLLELARASRELELVERLRSEGLREHHPELLDSFEPTISGPRGHAVTADAAPAAAEPRAVELRPKPGDDGLR